MTPYIINHITEVLVTKHTFLTSISLSIFCLGLCKTSTQAYAAENNNRPRLMILTDIGGDPDDQQSMIRLMVYANQFRIEGLIASASGTPNELKEAVTKPELIKEIVEAYGKVLPNLSKHENNWPSQEYMLSKIHSGNPHRGMANIGKGHDTDGSRHIVQQVDAGSHNDPLNISIWGGQTDLAQALWSIKNDRGEKGLKEFVGKMRIFDISDQDGISEWMRNEFPGMFYILSKAAKGKDKRQAAFRGMYLTGDLSLTSREWITKNIVNSGPLGALYPLKTWTAPNPNSCLKEGDTPSWFFFLPKGGNIPSDPTKPGWGGRYSKVSPGFFRDINENNIDLRTTVSRWRPDFQADFAKRMSWCSNKGKTN